MHACAAQLCAATCRAGGRAASRASAPLHPPPAAGFDGTTWVNVGSPDFSPSANAPNLAIAPDGTPYVGFQNGDAAYKGSVMVYSAGAWSFVGGTTFTPAPAGSPALAFSPTDGLLYAAFKDQTTNNNKGTVMKVNKASELDKWMGLGELRLAGSAAADELQC